MELRDSLAILRRRWPLVALITAATLLVAGVLAVRSPRAYEAVVRIAVSVGGDCPKDSSPYFYCPYYNWLSSEYLADDLSEVLRSEAFLSDVRATLGGQPAPGLVRDAVRVRKTHRILEVAVQAADADQAHAFARAIGEVVTKRGDKYLAQLAASSGQATLLEVSPGRPATTSGILAVDLAIRGGIGLLAGMFLAFAVDYVDSTLRSRREVERALGLPILAEIPSAR